MREPENEAAGSLSWSIRRHRVLGQCPRQYWFEYVGPDSSEASAEFRERLRTLRELVPLRFLRGTLVHDAIVHLVPSLIKGAPVDVEAACADLDQRIAEWEAHAAERTADAFNGLSLTPEVQAAMHA